MNFSSINNFINIILYLPMNMVKVMLIEAMLLRDNDENIKEGMKNMKLYVWNKNEKIISSKLLLSSFLFFSFSSRKFKSFSFFSFYYVFVVHLMNFANK